eukprot:Transcript_32063.p2 GENE.Transcript_32063~~Transcript_32063.p2  ORF type:complete len:523 (+),score=176.60 Transcript_32063:65-1633(+)
MRCRSCLPLLLLLLGRSAALRPVPLARRFASRSVPAVRLCADAASPPPPPPSLSVGREMMAIGLPALAGLAVDPIASLVDTAFVGRMCGSGPLTGAAVAIAVFNLISKTFNFFSPATTSLVAAEADAVVGLERGAFTPPMAGVASSALAVAMGGGLLIGGAMAVLATPLLSVLGLPPSSALHAPGRAYLLARALGTPASLALLALQGAFRGARDTATPLLAALVGTGLNLILDPLLIGARLLNWGVAGAALATSASQYAAVAMLTRALARRCGDECYAAGQGRFLGLPAPRPALCRRVALAGSLLTLRTLAGMASFSYSTVAAASLGAASGAAHQVCLQLWLATSLLADAIAFAAQPLLATCLAAKERRGARGVVRQALLLGAAAGAATAAALGLAGPALCRLFTTDPAALAAAATLWPLVVWSQPLNTLAFTLDGLLYGARDFRFCALAMGAASATAISTMALGRGRLGLRAVWCGLSLLMAVRTLGAVGRIASGTGPWAALGPWTDGWRDAGGVGSDRSD